MNPIEAAVAPLKNDAIEKAAKYADEVVITGVLAELTKHGMDATKAAPYPESNLRRMAYVMALMKYNLYRRITEQDADDERMKALKPWDRPTKSPDIRKRSIKAEAAFIENAKKDAAAQYDAFVVKLIEKCGPCTRASLKGSHVWDYSFLTVELWDETATVQLKREVWKTQQIVNVSKLGKVFNQWPTRKVKT